MGNQSGRGVGRNSGAITADRHPAIFTCIALVETFSETVDPELDWVQLCESSADLLSRIRRAIAATGTEQDTRVRKELGVFIVALRRLTPS